MVVKRQCSFCSAEIEPGTGAMFVKRDGTIYHFCSGSCRKQQLHLGRVGHRFKWTRAHALKKAADRSSAAARGTGPVARPKKSGSRAPGPVAVKPTAPAVETAAPAAGEKKPAKPARRTPKKASAPESG